MAIRHTSKVLFSRFALGKWLRLAFCSFLMGGGFPYAPLANFFTSPASALAAQAPAASADPMPVGWLAGAIGLGLLLGTLPLLPLLALLVWLSARGRFMFLDNVIRNRASIRTAWHDWKREAGSLYRFKMVFLAVMLPFWIAIVCVSFFNALPSLQTSSWDAAIETVSRSSLPLLLTLQLVASVIMICVDDLVVPVMHRQRLLFKQAWKQVLESLFRPYPWAVAGYLLVRILLDLLLGFLVLGMVSLLPSFLLLPYIGPALLLLPIAVFLLTYPLVFLQQLGPDWQMLAEAPAQPSAS